MEQLKSVKKCLNSKCVKFLGDLLTGFGKLAISFYLCNIDEKSPIRDLILFCAMRFDEINDIKT